LPHNLEKLSKEKFVYLNTVGRKSGKDHVVELWFATEGGKIYLSHEGAKTDWMKNIVKNSRVKMRIGSESLAGEATLTRPGSTGREAGMRSLYTKYYGPASKEVLDDWFELSTVVEISPT
jgi:deazaflavin-dependent oxidoreductase (nitroreductase family)